MYILGLRRVFFKESGTDQRPHQTGPTGFSLFSFPLHNSFSLYTLPTYLIVVLWTDAS